MQPPSAAASKTAAAARTREFAMTRSTNDIHDPLRDDNDTLRRAAFQGAANWLQGQDGGLDLGLCGVAGNGDIRTFLAIYLYRQGDGFLDQQVAVELRPGRLGDQLAVAERGPAFLGEVRHHRLHQ